MKTIKLFISTLFLPGLFIIGHDYLLYGLISLSILYKLLLSEYNLNKILYASEILVGIINGLLYISILFLMEIMITNILGYPVREYIKVILL